MRMMDILPEHVREWVASMKAGGVSPPTIRYAMVVLGAIFTTALNDQVTSLHPCRGVKTPPVPAQPRTILTPEQFAVLYELPARCTVQAAGGDRRRERPALGGAGRAARVRHRVRHPDADGQPGGRPGPPQVPSRGQPVPREALPQGQGIPALQAKRPDHHQAADPCHGA